MTDLSITSPALPDNAAVSPSGELYVPEQSAPQSLYERQREAEFQCILLGEQRYEKARRTCGESATPPGEYQTYELLPLLAKAIDAFTKEAAGGGAGRRHSALPYLLHIEPEQAAYLTVRHVIDDAVMGKSMTAIAVRVASAIEDHINALKLASEAPGLYYKVMQQLKTATSARHRTGVLRAVSQRYTPDKLQWEKREKLLLGVKLIELMEQSTTLIKITVERVGRNHTRARVRLTDEAQEWLNAAHEKCATFAPVHLPMLVPPHDWTSPFHGGYISGSFRGVRMIQSHSPAFLDEVKNVDMPQVYDAINIVQATPWRINRAILTTMQEARRLGDKYQALFVESDLPIPVRPVGIPTDVPTNELPVNQKDILIAWKREAAEAYSHNARLRNKRAAVGKQIWVADKYVDEKAIYFPHYLDFRGRMYPFASYLNPQADDSGRALLEFAHGKPLGERGLFWLKVHIANLFGVDKVSFEERVAWVDDTLDTLLGIAASPVDNIDAWRGADSPWMALAACRELMGALIEGPSYVSHIPIAMDGSCSGLQHYSAMLRDPLGGAEVNLIPSEKPADIYSEVARRAQAIVDRSADATAAAWQGGKVVRKVAKQPTMTLCYSATVYGMQGQIWRALDSLGGDAYLNGGVTARDGARFLAPVIWDAIGGTVIAARNAMKFLKGLATVAAQEELPIRWTAPSGFPIVQEYHEQDAQRVQVMYGGRRIRLSLNSDGRRLDKRRQSTGVAPNFVHSLDAAHLMATVNLGAVNELIDWAVVHDSFGVHAADVDTLHVCIRETFIKQYTPDVLTRLRQEVAAQVAVSHPELLEELPEVPPKGSLDLASVRESAYFFA